MKVPMTERVLVVDDDVELCGLVTRFLSGEGFDVTSVSSAVAGAERAVSQDYSLILLDVTMPDADGLEVLRRIRERSRVPVLMLTARGDTHDRIQGLEMGADDYLPKPFEPAELAARIRAILRRSSLRGSVSLAIGDVELDAGARAVRCRGAPVDLTAVEFDLLAMLMRSAGTVLSREDLVRNVLGREFSPFDRSIDTHVCNLRRKIGPLEDGSERIKGVRGAGYLYVAPSKTGSR